MQNYKQFYAKKKQYEKQILNLYPSLKNESGIYILTRISEYGIKYSYCGKAKHLLDRLSSHLQGYEQHIDRSLKSHKLYSEKNPYGWKIEEIHYINENELDENESYFIKLMHEKGYQFLNKESGGNQGKEKISEYKARKGYRDGVRQGEENARKFVANLFDKHLDYHVKKSGNKNQEKALLKFQDFLINEVTNG